jgi:hypothetical protein
MVRIGDCLTRVKRLAPHQTLLADFHSHPYPSNKAVTQKVGFDFSELDFDDFLDDDFLWPELNSRRL